VSHGFSPSRYAIAFGVEKRDVRHGMDAEKKRIGDLIERLPPETLS